MNRIFLLAIFCSFAAVVVSTGSQLRGEQAVKAVAEAAPAAADIPAFPSVTKVMYDIMATKEDTTAAALAALEVSPATSLEAAAAPASPFSLAASGPMVIEIKGYEGSCDSSELKTTSYRIPNACTPFGEYAGIQNITGMMRVSDTGAVAIYPPGDVTCSGTMGSPSYFNVMPGQCFSYGGGHGFVANLKDASKIDFKGLYYVVYDIGNKDNCDKRKSSGIIMMDEMNSFDYPRDLWGTPIMTSCKGKSAGMMTIFSIDKKMKAKVIHQDTFKLGKCMGPYASFYLSAQCW